MRWCDGWPAATLDIVISQNQGGGRCWVTNGWTMAKEIFGETDKMVSRSFICVRTYIQSMVVVLIGMMDMDYKI